MQRFAASEIGGNRLNAIPYLAAASIRKPHGIHPENVRASQDEREHGRRECGCRARASMRFQNRSSMFRIASVTCYSACIPWQLPGNIIFVPEISRTSVGKFKKSQLREMFAARNEHKVQENKKQLRSRFNF
jgi:acyl-CoA synthetase (AMP-forming)/AMP-acid ligase II